MIGGNNNEMPGTDPKSGMLGALLMHEAHKLPERIVTLNYAITIITDGSHVSYLTSTKFKGNIHQYDRHKVYQMICLLKAQIEAEIHTEALIGVLGGTIDDDSEEGHRDPSDPEISEGPTG